MAVLGTPAHGTLNKFLPQASAQRLLRRKLIPRHGGLKL